MKKKQAKRLRREDAENRAALRAMCKSRDWWILISLSDLALIEAVQKAHYKTLGEDFRIFGMSTPYGPVVIGLARKERMSALELARILNESRNQISPEDLDRRNCVLTGMGDDRTSNGRLFEVAKWATGRS